MSFQQYVAPLLPQRAELERPAKLRRKTAGDPGTAPAIRAESKELLEPESEVTCVRKQCAVAPNDTRRKTAAPEDQAELEKALRERVRELEEEVKSMHVLQATRADADMLDEHLRQRQMEYEDELRSLRPLREEVRCLRTRLRTLEQEKIPSLEAALEARGAALAKATRDCVEARRGVGAYEKVAARSVEAEKGTGAANVSPLALSLSWARRESEEEVKDFHQSAEDAQKTEQVADVQRVLAEKHLDRWKKATRKYVEEYRQGIYELIGWNVERREVGGQVLWHLTSRYADKAELVFQPRSDAKSKGRQMDLVWSQFGEQLTSDRGAMFYIEQHRSFPGFLAQVTCDLVTRKISLP